MALSGISGWWFVFQGFGVVLLWGCFGLCCQLFLQTNLCFSGWLKILKSSLSSSPCTSLCRFLFVCLLSEAFSSFLSSSSVSHFSFSLHSSFSVCALSMHFRHMTKNKNTQTPPQAHCLNTPHKHMQYNIPKWCSKNNEKKTQLQQRHRYWVSLQSPLLSYQWVFSMALARVIYSRWPQRDRMSQEETGSDGEERHWILLLLKWSSRDWQCACLTTTPWTEMVLLQGIKDRMGGDAWKWWKMGMCVCVCVTHRLCAIDCMGFRCILYVTHDFHV